MLTSRRQICVKIMKFSINFSRALDGDPITYAKLPHTKVSLSRVRRFNVPISYSFLLITNLPAVVSAAVPVIFWISLWEFLAKCYAFFAFCLAEFRLGWWRCRCCEEGHGDQKETEDGSELHFEKNWTLEDIYKMVVFWCVERRGLRDAKDDCR